MCEGVRMDGTADDETLDLLAAFGGEEQLLVFGFYPFGDHCQLHAATQGDDGAHDGDIIAVIGQAAHEGLVDFQGVDRQALEVAERGVAGAKVVDSQLNTQPFS